MYKEKIMSTIKLTVLAAAVVVGIPLASAFAAQQYGRDSVTVQPGQTVRSAPVSLELKRFGRDSLIITNDTVIRRPSPAKFGAVTPKLGRA
jgi:hypothetical protein